MTNPRQLRRLATNPADMMRYQATGKLPQGIKPVSPLIMLLERIGPRDLVAITGVTVDERLGYSGSRTFHTAAQALRWVKPAPEVFGTFYAESWRIKAFARELCLEDLAACCTGFPEQLARRRAELCRVAPVRRSPGP